MTKEKLKQNLHQESSGEGGRKAGMCGDLHRISRNGKLSRCVDKSLQSWDLGGGGRRFKS